MTAPTYGETVSGRLETGGERIYFESVGRGDAVVLCHGLGGNHASWWQQIPVLAQSHQVVTWDQRGFGNSTRRSGAFGPGPAVGDLHALVEHLGLGQAHVVGQSMGGWVAMGYALAHPQHLRSLVLTDTLAGVISSDVQQLAREAMGKLATRMATHPHGHPALSQDFAAGHPSQTLLYEQLSSFGDKPPEAEVLAMLGQTRFDLGAVRNLAVPTLLVCGALDDLCPPAAMDLIAALIPGAQLEVIQDAGHSPYFEQPEAWNAVVLGFLGAHA